MNSPLLRPQLFAFATAVAALVTFTALPTMADTSKFDTQMQSVLTHYLTIHDALARDTTQGVAAAALAIAAAAAKVDPSAATGEHAGHYTKLPEKITESAKALAQAKDLKAARDAFKLVSRPMAMWVTMSKPDGVSVVFCSMAKGSWLQKSSEIRNPYYGASMLACGEIVGGATAGQAGGHMQHGAGHKGKPGGDHGH